jgi:hypothetical protein
LISNVAFGAAERSHSSVIAERRFIPFPYLLSAHLLAHGSRHP